LAGKRLAETAGLGWVCHVEQEHCPIVVADSQRLPIGSKRDGLNLDVFTSTIVGGYGLAETAELGWVCHVPQAHCPGVAPDR